MQRQSGIKTRLLLLFCFVRYLAKLLLFCLILAMAYFTFGLINVLGNEALKVEFAVFFANAAIIPVLSMVCYNAIQIWLMTFLLSLVVNWKRYWKDNLRFFFTLNSEKYRLRRKVRRLSSIKGGFFMNKTDVIWTDDSMYEEMKEDGEEDDKENEQDT